MNGDKLIKCKWNILCMNSILSRTPPYGRAATPGISELWILDPLFPEGQKVDPVSQCPVQGSLM